MQGSFTQAGSTMNPKLKFNFSLVILIIGVLIFSLLALFFALDVYTPFFRGDAWRHLKHYYINGFINGHWESFFKEPHPSPLHALWFIVNVHWLGGLVLYDLILGYILEWAIFLLVAYYLIKNYGIQDSVFQILITASVVFSLKFHIVYSWPLVSLLNIAIFLSVLNLVIILKLVKSGKLFTWFTGIETIFAILSYVSFRDTLLLFFVSVAGSILLISVVNRSLFKWALYMFSITVISELLVRLLPSGNIISAYQSLSIISIMKGSIIGFDFMIFGGLARIGDWLIWLLRLFFYVPILIILLNRWKRIFERGSVAGLSFIFFSALVILGGILFRGEPALPRYGNFYEIGVIGIIFLLTYVSNNKGLLLKIPLLMLLIIQLLGLYNTYKSKKGYRNFAIKSEESLCKYAHGDIELDSLNRSIRGSHLSPKLLNFLKENKLNIYNPHYPYRNKKCKF